MHRVVKCHKNYNEHVNKLIASIIIIWSISTSFANGQTIEVDCSAKPLNELFIEWREHYHLQFSFNDAELSKHTITLKNSFFSLEDALSTILKNLPLDYEKNGEVYIIFPVMPTQEIKKFTLIGKVVEAKTFEPLPFSHVMMANGKQSVTDLKGMFSFNVKNDSVYRIKISHLGCYVLDTLLAPNQNHTIILHPSIVGIQEITVSNNIVEKSIQIGESAGLISLNHHIANYLPGNGDNAVFNLLRLQPGILAAGEQPNDLMIWGSPEGTSRVKFDGFTIWGLKNFNDNISAVNPYLAKNIEVLKGGYDVSNDDVIGGIVNISGKTGSTIQPSFNLFINNQTLNGMVELPIFKKSALLLAFRQTYSNLFDPDVINSSRPFQGNTIRINTVPTYRFRDFNVKYTLQHDESHLFFVSLLHGTDDFKSESSAEFERGDWNEERHEENRQSGATIYYGKTWFNGHSSNLKVSYSELQAHYALNRTISIGRQNFQRIKKDKLVHNDVKELHTQWENSFIIGQSNTLTSGIDYIHNEVILTEDTFSYQYLNLSERANRISAFIQDRVTLTKGLHLTAGLRYNYSAFTQSMLVDPRISLSAKINDHIKLNASWGQYHQFLVKSSVEDEDGNFRYSWTLADDDEIPVMQAFQWVVGGAYTNSNFLFSIDAFHKKNEGLTRFQLKERHISQGNSKSYGIDLYAKKDFNRHAVWASYSLSQTKEYYQFFPDKDYRRAPHDQRHEIKIAGLLDLRSFHFSASYIYGSGFPIYSNYIQQEYTEPDYNRVDAALIYKLRSKSFSGEIGLSILNVTNADNIKYNQFERVPLEQLNTVLVNTDAVPFTPLLYLKLRF